MDSNGKPQTLGLIVIDPSIQPITPNAILTIQCGVVQHIWCMVSTTVKMIVTLFIPLHPLSHNTLNTLYITRLLNRCYNVITILLFITNICQATYSTGMLEQAYCNMIMYLLRQAFCRHHGLIVCDQVFTCMCNLYWALILYALHNVTTHECMQIGTHPICDWIC